MRTREKRGDCAELLRGAEAADRNGLRGAFHRFFDGNLLPLRRRASESDRAVGRNHAGQKSVHRDSIASRFEREGLRPSDDCAAERVRYSDGGNRLDHAGRCDVQDSSPFARAHVGEQQVRDSKERQHHRVKLRLPNFRRHADHARGRRAAAVIEQDIDRPQLFARTLDGALNARPVREVRREANRAAASRFDFGYRTVENALISREHRDRNAFGCERVGDASADTFAPAQDECRLVAKLKVHFFMFLWSGSSRARL